MNINSNKIEIISKDMCNLIDLTSLTINDNKLKLFQKR